MYTTAVFHISTCPQQLLSIVLCTCPLSCLSIVRHVHYSCCSYFYMSTKLLNLVLHAHYTVAVVHSSTSTFPLQLLSTVVHVHCPLKLLSVVMQCTCILQLLSTVVHFHYSCCPQLYMSTKAVVSGYTVYMYTTAVVHSSTCPWDSCCTSIVLNVHFSCCSQFCIFGTAVYSCCPQFYMSSTAVVHSSECPLKLLFTVLHIRYSSLQLLSIVLYVHYSCCP